MWSKDSLKPWLCYPATENDAELWSRLLTQWLGGFSGGGGGGIVKYLIICRACKFVYHESFHFVVHILAHVNTFLHGFVTMSTTLKMLSPAAFCLHQA